MTVKPLNMLSTVAYVFSELAVVKLLQYIYTLFINIFVCWWTTEIVGWSVARWFTALNVFCARHFKHYFWTPCSVLRTTTVTRENKNGPSILEHFCRHRPTHFHCMCSKNGPFLFSWYSCLAICMQIVIAHVRRHVTGTPCKKSNPIFWFPTPTLPIHYDTFGGLRRWFMGVY